MSAGKLNRRITIQRRSATLDDYGQESSGWTDIATVWADVRPIGGREKLRSMAVESTLTHTVLVRYRTDLLPAVAADAWRIVYGTRILQITASMDQDDARKFIIFDCVETGAD